MDSLKKVSIQQQMKRDNVLASTRISLKNEELQQYEDRYIEEIRNKEDQIAMNSYFQLTGMREKFHDKCDDNEKRAQKWMKK